MIVVPAREPDYVFRKYIEFWFEEMVERVTIHFYGESETNCHRDLYLMRNTRDGGIARVGGPYIRDMRYGEEIQDAYKHWAAEKALGLLDEKL